MAPADSDTIAMCAAVPKGGTPHGGGDARSYASHQRSFNHALVVGLVTALTPTNPLPCTNSASRDSVVSAASMATRHSALRLSLCRSYVVVVVVASVPPVVLRPRRRGSTYSKFLRPTCLSTLCFVHSDA